MSCEDSAKVEEFSLQKSYSASATLMVILKSEHLHLWLVDVKAESSPPLAFKSLDFINSWKYLFNL